MYFGLYTTVDTKRLLGERKLVTVGENLTCEFQAILGSTEFIRFKLHFGNRTLRIALLQMRV